MSNCSLTATQCLTDPKDNNYATLLSCAKNDTAAAAKALAVALALADDATLGKNCGTFAFPLDLGNYNYPAGLNKDNQNALAQACAAVGLPLQQKSFVANGSSQSSDDDESCKSWTCDSANVENSKAVRSFDWSGQTSQTDSAPALQCWTYDGESNACIIDVSSGSGSGYSTKGLCENDNQLMVCDGASGCTPERSKTPGSGTKRSAARCWACVNGQPTCKGDASGTASDASSACSLGDRGYYCGVMTQAGQCIPWLSSDTVPTEYQTYTDNQCTKQGDDVVSKGCWTCATSKSAKTLRVSPDSDGDSTTMTTGEVAGLVLGIVFLVCSIVIGSFGIYKVAKKR